MPQDLSLPVKVFVLTQYDIDRIGGSFQVLRAYLDEQRAEADLELVRTGEGGFVNYKLDIVPFIVK